MGLVNYLRNKLKKSKAKKAQELHEEPLLVPHPPSSDHEWQKVDSREGSLGIEPDINLPGHLHQRAPTPALEPEREGIFRQTWGRVRQYVGKLLKKEPRASTETAAVNAAPVNRASSSEYSN